METTRIITRMKELLAEAGLDAGHHPATPEVADLAAQVDEQAAREAWKAVEEGCSRRFTTATAPETRTLDGEGGPVLRCSEMVELLAVRLGGEEIPAVTYPLDGPPYRWIICEDRKATAAGETITRRNIPEGRGNVEVTARWGYAETIPAELVEAAAQIAVMNRMEDLDAQERNPDLDARIFAAQETADRLMKPHRRWTA